MATATLERNELGIQSTILEKGHHAAEVFLKHSQHDILDGSPNSAFSFVSRDDNCIVFTLLEVTDKMPFKSSNATKEDFENYSAKWLKSHPEINNIEVRCDSISLCVLASDKAYIRRTQNMFGYEQLERE